MLERGERNGRKIRKNARRKEFVGRVKKGRDRVKVGEGGKSGEIAKVKTDGTS